MDKIQREFERTVLECGDENMSPEEKRAAMAYFRQGWARATRIKVLLKKDIGIWVSLIAALEDAINTINSVQPSVGPDKPVN